MLFGRKELVHILSLLRLTQNRKGRKKMSNEC